MKRFIATLTTILLFAVAFAQGDYNQNFSPTKIFCAKGFTTVKDTLFSVTGAGDTLYMACRGDSCRVWATRTISFDQNVAINDSFQWRRNAAPGEYLRVNANGWVTAEPLNIADSLNFSNGLNKVGNTINWYGPLSANTVISYNGASRRVVFGDSSGTNFYVIMGYAGQTYFNAGNYGSQDFKSTSNTDGFWAEITGQGELSSEGAGQSIGAQSDSIDIGFAANQYAGTNWLQSNIYIAQKLPDYHDIMNHDIWYNRYYEDSSYISSNITWNFSNPVERNGFYANKYRAIVGYGMTRNSDIYDGNLLAADSTGLSYYTDGTKKFYLDTAGGTHVRTLDSATIYALSGALLTNHPTYYCSNCTPTSGGSGGVMVTYNGSAWRRYW